MAPAGLAGAQDAERGGEGEGEGARASTSAGGGDGAGTSEFKELFGGRRPTRPTSAQLREEEERRKHAKEEAEMALHTRLERERTRLRDSLGASISHHDAFVFLPAQPWAAAAALP